MRVYQGLQLDPSILKQYIRNSSSAKEKRYYYGIMAARSLLIVAFAIVFIGGLSQIYGQENSPMAVVLRIVDTLLGVLLGMVFAWVFHHLVTARVLPRQEAKMT